MKTDTAFLAAVQDILTSLHAIEIEMPKEYLVEFTMNGLYIAGREFHTCSTSLARTASSLHLSIYQVCSEQTAVPQLPDLTITARH